MKRCCFVVSIIVFLSFANLAFAAPIGKVTLVEGRVDVLKAGRNVATPVSLGATVDVGDVYRAKSKGRAEIIFTNKNLIRIAPNTRIEITRYSVEGNASNTLARLYRGRVQAIGADDFITKAASFAEGNKFEIHTPNAVAGIRGTNMIVFFEKGATGAIFLSGRGYMYNPQQPQQVVLIVAGTISFVTSPGATPTPPRRASDAEMSMYTAMFTQGSSGGGGGVTTAGLAPVPGKGTEGGDGSDNIPPSPPPPVIQPATQTTEGPFYSNFNTDIWQTGSGLLWKGGLSGAFEGTESLWGSNSPLVTISGTYTNSATGTSIWSSKVDNTSDPYSYTHPMWSWNETAQTATTGDGGSYVGFAGGADYNGVLEGRFVGLYIDPLKNAGTLSALVSGIYADGVFAMLGPINRTFKNIVAISPVDFQANDTQDGIPQSYLSGAFPATNGTMGGQFGGTTLSIDDNPWGIYFLRAGGTYSIPASSWNAKMGGYTKFGAYYNVSSTLYHDNAYWIGNVANGSWGDEKITAVLNGQYISERRMGTITGDVIGTHNSGATGGWQAVSLGTWTGTDLTFGNWINPALRYYDPSSGWQTDGSFNGNMGGTSSIWSSSQSGPASFKIIAQYNPPPAGTHALIWNDGNHSRNDVYNGSPDYYTTYDGGSYDMNIGAIITASGSIFGKFAGISIDPYGHAALLRGGLTGTSYLDIGMLDVDGSIYRIEKGPVYLAPNQLKDAMVQHGALSGRTTRLAGTSPEGGTFTGATTDTFDNDFISFVDEANKITYPWGYYRHTLGGTSAGTISTWTGKIGGFHYFGDYYETPTTHTGSPGYWLADIASGTWTSGTFGGTASGTFLSATALGTISGDITGTYDTDTTWASRSSGTSSAISGIAFGENTFVATGFSGVILTSSDGATWTPRTSGTTNNLFEVIYGNGQFVTAGVSGTVLTSSDGITWTPQDSGTTNNLFGITYGNNKFVAVGGLITVASPDGITWTPQNPGVSLYGVTYGGSKFVAVGLSGAVLTSSDGITWTPQASGTSTALSYVSYGNGSFIAVGDSGAVLTSSDGITWTPQASGTANNLLGALCAKNKFVTVGNSGTILNGSNFWQAASTGVFEGTPLQFVSYKTSTTLKWTDISGFHSTGNMEYHFGSTDFLFAASSPSTASVTLMGKYTRDPSYPWNLVWWGETYNIISFNYLDNTYVTYDGGAFSGYLGGLMRTGTEGIDSLDVHIYTTYIDAGQNAGIVKVNLSGEGFYVDNGPMFEGIFKMSGSAQRAQFVQGIGILPADLVNSYDAQQLYYAAAASGDITFPTAGISTAPTTVLKNLTGENWGIFQGRYYGGYASLPPSNWTAAIEDLTEAAGIFQNSRLFGMEFSGTQWSDGKGYATSLGYGATTDSTPSTWVSIGELVAGYDAGRASATQGWQAIHTGVWLETSKFLAMAATAAGRTELQKINVPCVEVGVVDLYGSWASGSNTIDMTQANGYGMKGVKFFRQTANPAEAPRIWAASNVSGGYTGNPGGASVALSGAGSVTATFSMKSWNTGTGKWLATVTNGNAPSNATGSHPAFTFKGAAAGTINAPAAGKFSGTAAGTAK